MDAAKSAARVREQLLDRWARHSGAHPDASSSAGVLRSLTVAWLKRLRRAPCAERYVAVMAVDRAHWERTYAERAPHRVSWFRTCHVTPASLERWPCSSAPAAPPASR